MDTSCTSQYYLPSSSIDLSEDVFECRGPPQQPIVNGSRAVNMGPWMISRIEGLFMSTTITKQRYNRIQHSSMHPSSQTDSVQRVEETQLRHPSPSSLADELASPS